MKNCENQQAPRTKAGALLAFCIACLPVFFSYASGIPGFSLGDILLVVWVLYSILPHKMQNRYTFRIRMLIIGLLLIPFLTTLSLLCQGTFYIDSVIRIVRYFFYMFCLLYTAKKLLCVEALVKWVKIVAVLAFAYILLQYVLFYTFNYILVGFVRALPLYDLTYDRDYAEFYSMYRPTSFFLEPAHYARYSAIGLALFLFGEERISPRNFIASVCITLGIILSTSSQGYILVFIIWVIWFYRWLQQKGSQDRRVFKGIVILAGIVAVFAVLQIPVIQQTIARSFSGNGISDGNSAAGARLGGVFDFLKLPLLFKIIGMGYGQILEGVWFSSFVYWLYGCGLVVTILYLAFLCKGLFRLKNSKRIIWLLFFILFITDDCFYSYMCIIFFSLCLLEPIKEVKHE